MSKGTVSENVVLQTPESETITKECWQSLFLWSGGLRWAVGI